jgi:hypothetical protein
MAKYCEHKDAAITSGRRFLGVQKCPDCLLQNLEDLQAEFDLRMVAGVGPNVVHVQTWEMMQPAVDNASAEIARISAELCEDAGKKPKPGNFFAKKIREKFMIKI